MKFKFFGCPALVTPSRMPYQKVLEGLKGKVEAFENPNSENHLPNEPPPKLPKNK